MRNRSNHSDNYKVGKGRPPLETRWKPGQSGNPCGRPKQSVNIATIFHQALEEKITIRENGKTYKITAWEGIVRRLALDALNGDTKAADLLFAKEPESARKANPVVIKKGMSPLEMSRIYQRVMAGENCVFEEGEAESSH